MQEEELYQLMTSKEWTWEGLIRGIVLRENMDPWNIDISKLVSRYLEAVRTLKQIDLVVSGKFILAAAILLKMKSDYIFPLEPTAEAEKKIPQFAAADFELEPHLPMPKQRRVTLEELISSLKNALVVKEKRIVRHKAREVQIKLKIRKIDIGEKIKILHDRILEFFRRLKTEELTFSSLIPSKQKLDVIWTFIPLIHLANKGEVRLRQDECFGDRKSVV